MKKLKFVLSLFLTFLLTSCIFNRIVPVKKISSINANIVEKTRVEGDFFDINDINISLTYNDESTKDINYVDLEENDLIALFYYPGSSPESENPKYRLPADDFILDAPGEWTLLISNYDEKQKLLFEPFSINHFDVDILYIQAESFSLSDTSLSLSVDESQIITTYITPANTSSLVTWSSSDKSVATVDSDGKVTAVGEGQCTITAEIDGLSSTCIVTVVPYEETLYRFTNKQFNSSNGDWTYSKVGTSFDSTNARGVEVTSATTITSPRSYEKITYVYLDLFSSFSYGPFSYGKVTVYINGAEHYVARIGQDGKEYEGYIPIEGSLSGEVSIKFEPATSVFLTSSIYVKTVGVVYNNNKIYADNISITGISSIAVGSSDKLLISYDPVSCNQRDVTWTSSNEDILTISQDGTITGVNEGTGRVTAKVKVENGYIYASKDIEVVSVPVERITLNKSFYDIYQGSSEQIIGTVYPINSSYKELVFVSSNPDIATVDANGNVTGISIGKCNVTVSSERYPDISISCEINVTEPKDVTPTKMRYTTNDYTANNFYEIDSAPTIGNTKLLIIPVWFTDSNTFISSTMRSNVRDDIFTSFFGEASETGWQSVKSYYSDLSDGALNLNGTVSDWYECGNSSSTYAYSSGRYSNNIDPTCRLLNNAINWYFSTYTSDLRTNYDLDKNGYIDAVILIYGTADYVQRTNSNATNLWAYTYWLQDSAKKNVNTPGPNTFLFASYDFMYSSGPDARSRTGKNYGGGDTTHCTLDAHTYIHEMGHIFGLDDYYDYSMQYSPAGSFSMQDTNVGSHDPFSVMALGWGKTYIPTEACTITLKTYQSDHEVILLTPSWNEYDSPFDEYLLIEFYSPTGLNDFDCNFEYNGDSAMGPKTYGIRLWHVDARLAVLNSNMSPTSIVNYPTPNCYYGISNTYEGTLNNNNSSSHLSVLGKSYYSYNFLQLIRNDKNMTYNPTDDLSSSSLFKQGDSFDMTSFRRQFKNSGKLNSGLSLGWKFSVNIVENGEESTATITLTKD